MYKKGVKKISSKKDNITIRRNQAIVPFGIGAIVDFPNLSLMPCGIDLWDKNAGTVIHDERLERSLGVSYFKMPPTKDEHPRGIPFVRFPKYMFCPKCRSIKSIDEWNRLYLVNHNEPKKIPRCNSCNIRLVASRFIVACRHGHIDDFPYEKWVHLDNLCGNPKMEIRNTGGSTTGLEGIIIKCTHCNRSRTMKGAFNPDALAGVVGCTGNMPWQNDSENCEETPHTLQRGGSNAYFPKIVTSIVIPPGSDNITAEIEKTSEWEVLCTMDIDNLQTLKNMLIPKIALKLERDENEIRTVVERKLKLMHGTNEEEPDEIDNSYITYLNEEYQAFLGNISEGSISSNDFSIEILSGDQYKISEIQNVVLIHRLREVRALVGFTRLTPPDKYEMDIEELEKNEGKTSTIVSVKKNKKINWYPASEVRGEGIFIQFNDELLNSWVNQHPELIKRASVVNHRYNEILQARNLNQRTINSKYLFLHTFSHLLIRQLCFECGYASASLKERIYCNENELQPSMCGVLIYTASGDSEGTLGGLVRQGRPDFLPNIIIKALENSQWCSNDPVCMESSGQGMDSLNLAACHACALLPETSCEESNRLLDRTFVVGDNGFLQKLLF